MNVILMGNGPFAVPLLSAVHASSHSIRRVITRPDRPQGKRQQIVEGPVCALAKSLGLPADQPEDVNDAATIARLKDEHVDLLVVADFGQILSSACLGTTPLGGINVHASLLPKYRGAAPVAWAILQGESETGVSIIRMTPQLDAGGILLQRSTPIEPNETAGDLESRLAQIGAEAAVEAIDRLAAGRSDVIHQEKSLVTKAPRLSKEMGRIDWTKSAQQIHDLIRGLQPWPVAYSDWQREGAADLRLQILSSEPMNSSSNATPGQVLSVDRDGIVIATGGGSLRITKLKPAGKKEMDVRTFLNGNPMQAGQTLA